MILRAGRRWAAALTHRGSSILMKRLLGNDNALALFADSLTFQQSLIVGIVNGGRWNTKIFGRFFKSEKFFVFIHDYRIATLYQFVNCC